MFVLDWGARHWLLLMLMQLCASMIVLVLVVVGCQDSLDLVERERLSRVGVGSHLLCWQNDFVEALVAGRDESVFSYLGQLDDTVA